MKLLKLYTDLIIESDSNGIIISKTGKDNFLVHFNGIDKNDVFAQIYYEKLHWYLSMIQTGDREGTGYGRKLMEFIINEAKKHGIKKITLDSSLYNKDFFEIFGFVDVEYNDDDGLYSMELNL